MCIDQHNVLKFLHLWHKGLLKWIHSKIVFNMQAVFIDITPDILPTNLCKRWVFNNSGKQTIAKKMKADLDETIENLDEELGSHNWKFHSETRNASAHTSRNGKVLMKNKACFSEHGTPYADWYVLPCCKITIQT